MGDANDALEANLKNKKGITVLSLIWSGEYANNSNSERNIGFTSTSYKCEKSPVLPLQRHDINFQIGWDTVHILT